MALFFGIVRRACAPSRARSCRLPVGLRAAASGTLLASAFVSAAWFDQATLGCRVAGVGHGLGLPIRDARESRAARTRPMAAACRTRKRSRVRQRPWQGASSTPATWPGLRLFAVLCALLLVGAWCFVCPRAVSGAAALARLCLLACRCSSPVAPRSCRPTWRCARARSWQVSRSVCGARRASRSWLGRAFRKAAPRPTNCGSWCKCRARCVGSWAWKSASNTGPRCGGSAAAPFVLIRAREGSAVVSALPRELIWTRGRKADERAALLRPRLPTVAHCERLLLELVAQLRESDQTPGQRSRSNRSTVQAAASRSVLSPAHVL